MRASVRTLMMITALAAAALGCDPPQPPPTVEPSSCAAVLCLVGHVCVERGGKAVCVPAPDPTNDPCAAVRCAAGTHCEAGECVLDDPCTQIVNGSVQPLCRAGERCVVQQVMCVRAPCPPQAHCEAGCICTREYRPVCGTDGKTYGNACEARCAGVTIAHEGECGASRACVDEVQGSETSCKPAALWKQYASEACASKGLVLTDHAVGTPCTGGNHRYVKYSCCPAPR